MPIDVLIEGFLFYKSAPQKKRTVMKIFDISEEDFTTAMMTLHERLKSGATRVIETDHDIQLVTAPELAPVIEELRKNEMKNDIGKAGAETLAIILYQSPVSRGEIDRIRGVNSSFILRNLLIRGLIEKEKDVKSNQTKFVISPALLAELGVTRKQELPDFAQIADTLEKFSADYIKEDV
ncbi:MAG: SMC-Scp complex subunit ScpB [Candidatus Nomurabacteria bacterium]|nr:MAG: SMC-Scp complex subunit ScpB [Candidatus Nomurabacteria bacterium]